MTSERGIRVFATVGTDHHRFDRLIDWVDRWLDEPGRPARVEVVVQAGASRSPRRAVSAGILPFDEFRSALAKADAVVCHGGPGTIVEARLAGHLPLVVPRRPELGEHVDDHQVRFSAHLADRDEIVLIENYESLVTALESTLTARRRTEAHAVTTGAGEAIARFAELVRPLIPVREARR